MHPIATYLLLILGLLLSTNPSFAQSKNIKGQVVYMNSKAQHGKIIFVEDAKVSSPISGSVKTDEKGRFKLKLKSVYDGQPIFFQVKKDKFQVVDHKSLQYTLIDKKPRLRISLAKKGYIKQLRSIINSHAFEALSNEENELLDLLAFGGSARDEAIKLIEKRTGQKLNSTFDAEELIDKLAEKIEEHIRYASYELAIINHDFASNFWLSAMESYNRSDLKAAIEKLQEENVDQLAEEIIANIEKVKNRPKKVDWIILNKLRELETIKNNYTFQIIALQQTLRLTEANLVIKKLAKINDAAPTHKHTQFLEKMDFFPTIDPIEEDASIVFQKENKPSTSKNSIVEKPEPAPSLDKIEKETKLQTSEIATTEKVKSSTKEIVTETKTEKLSEEKIIVENQSKNIVKISNPTITVEESNSPTPSTYKNNSKQETPVPSKNVIQNQAQPATTQRAINQGDVSRTKIVITISTSNEIIKEATPASEYTPPTQSIPHAAEKIETITSVEPVQHLDELAVKGEPTPPVQESDSNDFENILFQTKVVKKNFNNYLKQKTPVTTEDRLQ